MLKAVLDTNVIISGLISHGGAPYRALEAWRRGDFLLFTSPALLDELLDVLARPFFREKRGIADSDLARIRHLFETDASCVQPQVQLGVIQADPDDDRVLECALAGGVDFVVSGDRHLLSVREYQRIPIITVVQFLEILRRDTDSAT